MTTALAAEGQPPPLIAARNLSAGYHGHPVVRDLNLEVYRGSVVALLGPNGAGKTTTLMTLAGELQPLGGQLLVDGSRSRAPLHRRCKNGLGFVTEERSVFMGLSVLDNLKVARCEPEDVFTLFPALKPLARRRVGNLSGGEQQMLALGRALARHPRLLLADELSLGLAPLMVTRLLEAVREAAETRGVGVLLVEQHVRKALAVADRVCVMRRGEIVLDGASSDFVNRLSEFEASYF